MLRAAIIDMYNGTPNLGLPSILRLLETDFPHIKYDVFDIRAKNEMPDLSYDIYISTGGPGNPVEGNKAWENGYFQLLDDIFELNQKGDVKKFMFFICHSFQIACQHFGVGTVNKRPQESFGIFRVAKTAVGQKDRIFELLPEPFYAADFRKYQVISPDTVQLQKMGGAVLAMEDPRNHNFPDKAMMAVRFSETMYGVQFHPEAHPQGMFSYFQEKERKSMIFSQFGAASYEEMMFHMRDPIKIGLTYKKVLPGFLEYASRTLTCSLVPAT